MSVIPAKAGIQSVKIRSTLAGQAETNRLKIRNVPMTIFCVVLGTPGIQHFVF
jgi:hypothetical protein